MIVDIVNTIQILVEGVGAKHRRFLGLAQEMINVAVSEDITALKRRER